MKTSTIVILVVAVGGLAMMVVLCAVAIIGGAVYWQAKGNRPNLSPPQMYFTVDDGKSHFVANASRIPPFDYNGSPAVRVYLFKCGSNGPPFASYLERYTPEAAKKMAELMKSPSDDPMAIEELQMNGIEVKKAGGSKWVLRNTPAGEKLVNDITCPDGTTNLLEPVSPE
jgi:hypothetical protein